MGVWLNDYQQDVARVNDARVSDARAFLGTLVTKNDHCFQFASYLG
jgi:hypothetical protein